VGELVLLSQYLIKAAQRDQGATKKMKKNQTIWANYDPDKIKEGLRKIRGALQGVDRDTRTGQQRPVCIIRTPPVPVLLQSCQPPI
jgi:hypothetical protein